MTFHQSVPNYGRFINTRILHTGVLPTETDWYYVCFFVMVARRYSSLFLHHDGNSFIHLDDVVHFGCYISLENSRKSVYHALGSPRNIACPVVYFILSVVSLNGGFIWSIPSVQRMVQMPWCASWSVRVWIVKSLSRGRENATKQST